MEDIFTNKIDRESLKPGDHIYAYRKCHIYSHHGIFIGEDRVIHYNVTQERNRARAEPCKKCGVDINHLRGVVKSCIDCFLKGHSLRRFQYRVSGARYLFNRAGTCTTGRANPQEDTVAEANNLFHNGFGDYNLFENNCEAFAVFCKTGKYCVADQAWTARHLIRVCADAAMGRLLRDVLVHYGEDKAIKLKQKYDICYGDMSSIIKIIAALQNDQEYSGHEAITS